MLKELICENMDEGLIDKIIIDGIKNDFPIMKSDFEFLPDGKVKVSTENSRTGIRLQMFGFKPV